MYMWVNGIVRFITQSLSAETGHACKAIRGRWRREEPTRVKHLLCGCH